VELDRYQSKWHPEGKIRAFDPNVRHFSGKSAKKTQRKGGGVSSTKCGACDRNQTISEEQSLPPEPVVLKLLSTSLKDNGILRLPRLYSIDIYIYQYYISIYSSISINTIYLSIHRSTLSIYRSTLSIYLSIYQHYLSIHLSTLSLYPSIHPSIYQHYLSIYQHYLSIYPSIDQHYLSIHPSIHLSIHRSTLSLYPSIHPSIYQHYLSIYQHLCNKYIYIIFKCTFCCPSFYTFRPTIGGSISQNGRQSQPLTTASRRCSTSVDVNR